MIFSKKKKVLIIEEVPETGTIGETHYLPHRAVIRDDKSTTKVRAVFDPSSKIKPNVPSLSECP